MRATKRQGFEHQRLEFANNVWFVDASLYDMDDGRQQFRVHRVHGDINGPWLEAVKAFIERELQGENVEVVK